jgi:sulfur carrier protein
MNITINGEPAIIIDRSTVKQLLEQRGLDRSPCAVEVNRQVVPKRKHNDHRLNEGDKVEIVTLVGGG